jgi:hypothetical protein
VKRAGLKNIEASVQARLVGRSRELGVEHQLTLARFGGERLLYRLSKSEFADRFILKGAALLLVWLGEQIRPTKDVDLLGFGDTSADALRLVFVALCAVESPDDGLIFLPDSVHVRAIRENQEYGGMRVKLTAMLGTVQIPLQVDVGAGDAVVPHRKSWTIPAYSTFRAPDSAHTGRRPRLPRRPKQWCVSLSRTAV